MYCHLSMGLNTSFGGHHCLDQQVLLAPLQSTHLLILCLSRSCEYNKLTPLLACTFPISPLIAALVWPTRERIQATMMNLINVGSTRQLYLYEIFGLTSLPPMTYHTDLKGPVTNGSGAFISRDKQALLLPSTPNALGITVWLESSPKNVLKAVICIPIVTLGMRLRLFLLVIPSYIRQDLPEQTAPASWAWE